MHSVQGSLVKTVAVSMAQASGQQLQMLAQAQLTTLMAEALDMNIQHLKQVQNKEHLN